MSPLARVARRATLPFKLSACRLRARFAVRDRPYGLAPMPIEIMLAGASAFFLLLLLGVLVMKAYPKVVLAAPPKHPCGFVPNL